MKENHGAGNRIFLKSKNLNGKTCQKYLSGVINFRYFQWILVLQIFSKDRKIVIWLKFTAIKTYIRQILLIKKGCKLKVHNKTKIVWEKFTRNIRKGQSK